MSDTLTVIVPAVPVRALSPNASRKQHWGTAHREREALRAATHLATRNTLNAQNGQRPGPPYRVTVRVEWGKGGRRMDDDNIIAALKAARDVVATYLGHDDAEWTYTGVTQGRDPDGLGRTIFTIEGKR
jgi:hypothetical protein